MVHTAQFFTRITPSESEGIKQVGQYFLTANGITSLKAHTETIGERNYHFCIVIINLERLRIQRQTPLPFTVNPKKIRELEESFTKVMARVLPKRANISKWYVQRVDYTKDIKTPFVKEYIQLLQQGDKPRHFHIDNSTQKRSEENKTHYPNSVRYRSNSCVINIYDKYEERKTQKGYPKELLNKCGNILRVELQCFNTKLASIKRKYELPKINPLTMLIAEKEQKSLFSYYLNAISGQGDYYKMEQAKKIINSQLRAETSKQKVIAFLEQVRAKRSVWKAKRNYDKLAFDKAREILRKLNINATIIPRGWKNEHLENIFHLRE